MPDLLERVSAFAAAANASPADLAARKVHRRAVEAVLWGMPLVNYDLMLQALRRIGGGPNQILYWSRLLDWKNQTLTPNPDAIYVMPFFDLADGPMVLEIPPAEGGSITGSIDDCWQTAIEDVGPAGADQGQGGRYLLTPPGYTGEVPAGYIHRPSPTHTSYALLRSILQGGADAEVVAAAVAYARRIRVYPLSAAADPPPSVWHDAVDAIFDATIPYDLRFFEALARMIEIEPWLQRDRAMIDRLKSLGIERGKAFAPDPATRTLLEDAAREAHEGLALELEAVFETPFDPSARWTLPVTPDLRDGLMDQFANPDAYPTDARGVLYSFIFFSAKRLGAGQYYLMTLKDRDGARLDGSATYRLTVPPKAPVRQYWSATVYDGATHAFIRGAPRANRSSQSPGLQPNPDGSVDVFFAPKAPDGREANWVPTEAGHSFEVLFRLYGPEPAFFDKTWKLPDIEKVG